ncbi:sirohydrochlorin chelatase [Tessaracoccus caeni]|uniref:sirohydrochlorin chelatase n=1 Tax=Tessaracoccus caeni TaxID=3031239 RepID=UPI0023DA08C3|nr:CbiX/SirB N-terminal domain-containing protein [Tessaracoccus caeni]MDF1487466.1 CbiX/SirB N-terminal domain-containing protein [Tessaracoccus caeni]
MSTSHTVVLAWHGTRHPDGTVVPELVRRRVARLLPDARVVNGWVDLIEPTLSDVLAQVGDATVVPCFLAAGYHVRHDIPEAAAASGHHVEVTRHIGGLLTDAVIERLAESGGPGDAVVLAAAGSKRPNALAEIDAVAAELEERLGVPVVPGNVYMARPSVADAVDRLRAEGHRRITVAPYLLSQGLWSERIEGLGVRVAEPLGDHPMVAQAIVGLVAPRLAAVEFLAA